MWSAQSSVPPRAARRVRWVFHRQAHEALRLRWSPNHKPSNALGPSSDQLQKNTATETKANKISTFHLKFIQQTNQVRSEISHMSGCIDQIRLADPSMIKGQYLSAFGKMPDLVKKCRLCTPQAVHKNQSWCIFRARNTVRNTWC